LERGVNQQRVLISGTSRGIGKYLANYYLDKECIVFGCSRSKSDISHENYRHFILDITNEGSVKEMFSIIRREYQKIDVLINNVAVMITSHALISSLRSVKEMMDTNFIGTYLLSKEAAKIMKKDKFGRIVNFSSLAVPLNLEGEAAYIASKSAIESFTRVLSFELVPFNITVNTVGPSLIQTDILKNITEDQKKKILDKMALRKFGHESDVANVIDFFIDEKSSAVTGQTIYLGGAPN